MTNSDFISNVDELVAGGRPFLLWSLPGSDEYMLSEPSRVTVGAFSGKIYTSGIAIPPRSYIRVPRVMNMLTDLKALSHRCVPEGAKQFIHV